MAIIIWSEEFNTNIREVDDQHKKLVQIINDFDDALKENRDEKTLCSILDDLLSDTSSHFTREESIMELYEYPEHGIHREEHDILSKEVTNMFKGYRVGDKDKSEKITNYLRGWLMDHIVNEDKKLGKYLVSKGVS